MEARGFPPNVEHCFHAMALDESRALFPLTRLGKGRNTSPRLQEVWFRGVHSDVGGGNGNLGLNWLALNWMYEAGRTCGVPLDEAAVAKNLLHKQLAQQISQHKVDLRVLRTILESDLPSWQGDERHQSLMGMVTGRASETTTRRWRCGWKRRCGSGNRDDRREHTSEHLPGPATVK
jgi:hypothetical protein